MNKYYELKYTQLEKKQIKELSFEITLESIEEYFSTHQTEYNNWQQIELLSNIINKVIPINISFTIDERKKMIQNFRINKEIKIGK